MSEFDIDPVSVDPWIILPSFSSNAFVWVSRFSLNFVWVSSFSFNFASICLISVMSVAAGRGSPAQQDARGGAISRWGSLEAAHGRLCIYTSLNVSRAAGATATMLAVVCG